MGSSGGGAGALFLFLFVTACYLGPTIIAFMRKHKDAPAIAALNVLLGWSVIGWIMAFIWALADPAGRNARHTVVVNTVQNNSPTITPAAAPVANEPTMEDRDLAFWDGITDKNDADQLEEYLIRFPDGRFANLAKARFERHQQSAAPVSAAEEPPVAEV